MTTTHKTCNVCLEVKEIECFLIRKNYKHRNDLRYNQCKKCINERLKKYRKNNPEKIKALELKRNSDVKRRYQHAKYEAERPRNKNKKNWTITYEEYEKLQLLPCHYCNNLLHDKNRSSGSGLDRIDNALGYSLDNVQPCCKICNWIRADNLSVFETEKLIDLLLNLRGLK